MWASLLMKKLPKVNNHPQRAKNRPILSPCHQRNASVRCSPLGLVPEVPLLQAFEDESGRGLSRLVVAGLAVISLNITLLELSLPLHSLVKYDAAFSVDLQITDRQNVETRVLIRVARFFLVKNTKTGKTYQITTK
jgi:hypothetical protein